MPVIEAMACGAPVVTSNRTALPEVAGNAALLVNPEDDEELAGAMVRILRDTPLRESLRAKGFDLSRNDRRVIIFSQFLAELGPEDKTEDTLTFLIEQQPRLEAALDDPLFTGPVISGKETCDPSPVFTQRSLFDD